ncbi:hypothetical protein TCAL_02271 [Tigriopus californicus]|uniref:Ammonium transporter AmtB-like domain-containing protein n=1 Tax=Tigriopus californicus TaxID=6832 RepID=A0A553NNJ8_TIGCA|nr:ammonium transporter 3-like [Tigriopus californicus]TRY67021.1 hypothetical protein TCAL_02271 [Tigriopus californicus]|eukprot:TCALIF_02271-PA protein Name:"Similar to sll0108 Putative ammonium transporter sll0108 (Synechocystis sp. (strain PCC 6803 / Kazusa))" AED:0.04 eAED:0.04 QI:85/1/1/1/0.75/0.8/5/76/626
MPGKCECFLSKMPEDLPDPESDIDILSISVRNLLFNMGDILHDNVSGNETGVHSHHNPVMDGFFALVFGILALLGPFGLALVQSGLAQRRNVVSILLKPLIQFCCGVLSFWAVGSGFSIGSGNFFIGLEHFFFNELDSHHFPQWFFQCCTAVYCVSIAASGGFERNRMRTDFMIAILVPSVLFPIPAHWCWHFEGWLVQAGYVDYAGGGVIHVIAGGCGLVLVLLGQRRHHHPEHGIEYRDALLRSGHNISLAILGGLFNIIGCLAIQLGAGGDHFPQQYHTNTLAKVILNSSLALATGGMMAFILGRLSVKQWSVYRIFGGMIAGLVCACPGTDVLNPWASVVIGAVGGLVYIPLRSFVKTLRLDDPLEVISVHLVPGLLGLILLPFFHPGKGIFWRWDSASGWYLAMNIAGAFTLLLWASIVSLAIFGCLALCGMLKYDMETQVAGIDERTMREIALSAMTSADTFAMSNINNNDAIHHHVKFMDPAQSSLMNGATFNQSTTLNYPHEPLMASTQKELKLPRLVLEEPQESHAIPETPSRAVPPMSSNHRRPSYERTPIISRTDDVFDPESPRIEILSSLTRENIRQGLKDLKPTEIKHKRPSLALRRPLTPSSRSEIPQDMEI